MRNLSAGLLVFLGGFAIMVLEIIGARLLAKDFGSSFYIWVSQIGVVLTALALGYSAGGWLADWQPRLRFLCWLLAPAALFIYFIPNFSPRLIGAIIERHPADKPIPAIWQKLDPALGSSLVFLLPCFVLATLSPFMVRLSSQKVSHVGRISGGIYAASTVGSIAGVFVSGYLLMDWFSLSQIFRGVGILTAFLAACCWCLDRQFREVAA